MNGSVQDHARRGRVCGFIGCSVTGGTGPCVHRRSACRPHDQALQILHRHRDRRDLAPGRGVDRRHDLQPAGAAPATRCRPSARRDLQGRRLRHAPVLFRDRLSHDRARHRSRRRFHDVAQSAARAVEGHTRLLVRPEWFRLQRDDAAPARCRHACAPAT